MIVSSLKFNIGPYLISLHLITSIKGLNILTSGTLSNSSWDIIYI